MAIFWQLVNRVMRQADVLLLLLDARMVDETRNDEIEDKARRLGKPLIYVITKCDLVEKDEAEQHKKELNPCVFISATEHFGVNKLRERILIEAKRIGLEGKQVKVGVLGYPNVGKSSLINALKGRKSAKTSSMSGYTKHIQKIKADNRIVLIDTPGVIPYKERDQVKHALIGTTDYTKEKDPDVVAVRLMEMFPGKIEAHYGVEQKQDKEETLVVIAVKKNLLMKGNKPDIQRTATMILKDWQNGEIR